MSSSLGVIFSGKMAITEVTNSENKVLVSRGKKYNRIQFVDGLGNRALAVRTYSTKILKKSRALAFLTL